MAITLLYDSEEWSNRHLTNLLNKSGLTISSINLEKDPLSIDLIQKSKLIINRIFPSSFLRGHTFSFHAANYILRVIHNHNIQMLNPYSSYFYDFSKSLASQALLKAKLPVPGIFQHFTNPNQINTEKIKFPVVLKPDCGGRSKFTSIIRSQSEFNKAFTNVPIIPYIMQEYIDPDLLFTTRIEIIDNKIISIMKRFVNNHSISSYHTGSKYLNYPLCPIPVQEAAIKALLTLDIKMGSLDIIEQKNGKFYIIDINATSNFSEDYLDLMGFDPIHRMADFILTTYQKLF